MSADEKLREALRQLADEWERRAATGDALSGDVKEMPVTLAVVLETTTLYRAHAAAIRALLNETDR